MIVLTKLYGCAITCNIVVKESKKEKQVRVHLVMPESLHKKLNNYCNSIMKGKPRLKSAVISNAIEEFLDKQKVN